MNFRWTPLAAAQRIRNLIFGGVRAGNLKIKNGSKHQKRLKEVSAGEIGRLIQAVAHYCGTWPTGSNTTKVQIRRIVEALEEIH